MEKKYIIAGYLAKKSDAINHQFFNHYETAAGYAGHNGEVKPVYYKMVDVQPGLYIVHWQSGGTSKAAIGIDSSGNTWIAPTNWVKPGMFDIDTIDRLEKVA